jgi:hypothetical protein
VLVFIVYLFVVYLMTLSVTVFVASRNTNIMSYLVMYSVCVSVRACTGEWVCYLRNKAMKELFMHIIFLDF